MWYVLLLLLFLPLKLIDCFSNKNIKLITTQQKEIRHFKKTKNRRRFVMKFYCCCMIDACSSNPLTFKKRLYILLKQKQKNKIHAEKQNSLHKKGKIYTWVTNGYILFPFEWGKHEVQYQFLLQRNILYIFENIGFVFRFETAQKISACFGCSRRDFLIYWLLVCQLFFIPHKILFEGIVHDYHHDFQELEVNTVEMVLMKVHRPWLMFDISEVYHLGAPTVEAILMKIHDLLLMFEVILREHCSELLSSFVVNHVLSNQWVSCVRVLFLIFLIHKTKQKRNTTEGFLSLWL